MIVGRDLECRVVSELLAGARAGHAGVLLMVGEAGIGKTALLDLARDRGQDMIIAQTVGLESEATLEFSGLYDVCRPLLAHLDDLPERQRGALMAALGLKDGAAVDRFTVGAAVLSLITAAAEVAALLVVVDDAQWVDAASLDALRFAFHRLRAERVAVLVATRSDDSAVSGERQFASMALAGIDAVATGLLLAERVGEDVASGVAERIQLATGGNPLALVEIAARLDRRQVKGLEPIEEPLPLGPTLEALFAVRIDQLGESSRLALLVAAVSASTRLVQVLDALDRLGLDLSALESAEAAGLVQLEPDAVTFRHPLVRSAVVHGSVASDRRRAHAALAAALVGRSEDERAYHLAAAALGPNRTAADALWASARRSLTRSGWASAGIALERSARLTPQLGSRSDRLLEAAEAAWVAGRISVTLGLLEEVLGEAGDPPHRGRARRLRTMIRLHSGNASQALDGLLDDAAHNGSDPQTAVALLADAVEAALLVGDVRQGIDAGTRAYRLAPDGSDSRFAAAFALGQALDEAGRTAEARQLLEDALAVLNDQTSLQNDIRACTRGAEAAGRLGRVADGLELAARACALARDEGAYEPLAHALAASTHLEITAGRWAQASAHADEGLELAQDSHCAWSTVRCLEQLAWLRAVQGATVECRRFAQEAATVAAKAGFTSRGGSAALGILELGLGHPEEAAGLLASADRTPNPDLIEALMRCGRTAEAKACPQPGGATGYRCRGLWTDNEEFDAEFAAALALHTAASSAGGAPFAAARTQLCYGERLRRAGRRVDARVQLRAARDGFERLGALPWADRAAAELRATGERLGRQPAEPGDDLTVQEHQVARLAADGATNKAIAGSLFLSPKTVDFHLRRAFRKLDVSSRSELIKLFAAAAR